MIREQSPIGLHEFLLQRLSGRFFYVEETSEREQAILKLDVGSTQRVADTERGGDRYARGDVLYGTGNPSPVFGHTAPHRIRPRSFCNPSLH